ncbi:hypothetical protein AAFF_G00290200 [Aldrovandia affinis]|uniref:Uncharacterized protein n=1 Tax=Aldrovandia affinis TaxID=143900 RepID=A0AAD7RA73_9TELE|nr:hypothetical protein AAFF_G00290200 [Aldrovandia affinis]
MTTEQRRQQRSVLLLEPHSSPGAARGGWRFPKHDRGQRCTWTALNRWTLPGQSDLDTARPLSASVYRHGNSETPNLLGSSFALRSYMDMGKKEFIYVGNAERGLWTKSSCLLETGSSRCSSPEVPSHV